MTTSEFIAAITALIGPHAASTALQIEHLELGLMDAFMWPDSLAGAEGWWWAVAYEGGVFALGFARGDRVARDVLLARMIGAPNRRRVGALQP